MNETSEQLEREWVEEPAVDLLRVLFNYKPLSPEDVRRLRDGLATEPVLTVRLADCLKRLILGLARTEFAALLRLSRALRPSM